MKTLHKYLARQILASLSLTVVVFTFVLLVGNLLKEILSLLVTWHARLGLMLEAIGLLVPFLWVYALPMGLLTATLLVFGRFSADQELTAARASGISLVSLITPVLWISLACCGLSAWINLDLGPRSRVAYLNVIYQVRHEMAAVQIPEDTFIHDFPGYLIRVDKNRGGELEGVKIIQFSSDTNHPNPIVNIAPRGHLVMDEANKQMWIYLTNVNQTVIVGAHERDSFAKMVPIEIDLNSAATHDFHPHISDMTYRQLCQEMRDEDAILRVAPPKGATPAELREQMHEIRQQRDAWTLPVRVEMSRRIAFSFAGFSFALIGIPLGIRVHRKETNIGMLVALILALVFYSFFYLGVSLSNRPEFYPQFIVWIPSLLFQAVGAVLLWRANRGF